MWVLSGLWGDTTGWGPIWCPLASTVPRTSSLQKNLPRTSLTLLRGCGELVRTCGEVPLDGVQSWVHCPQDLLLSDRHLCRTTFDYLERLWRAGENLWGGATVWGPVLGRLAPIVPTTSSLHKDLPRISLTILRGCGELVRTCGKVPLGGVLSGDRLPPLSPESLPFR